VEVIGGYMKRFNVEYAVTILYDANVFAETKKKAIAKVIEVIGEDIKIKSIQERPMNNLAGQKRHIGGLYV
jgi:hypothetical protein